MPGAPPASGARIGLTFVLIWVPYLWLARRFWFLTDDAYITFRYAKNWADGHGPRFNPGDHTPIEGYSNFLWMALCALFEKLGLNVELWPNLASIGCGSVLIFWMLTTLHRRLELCLPLAALATLILGLHPSFATYSTSGLATMPFMLALFGAFERLVLRRDGIEPLSTAALLIALALLRVEGLYWGAVLVAMGALARGLEKKPVVRPLLVALGILAVVYATYFAWRYDMYGRPFSNTVYAKSGTSLARLERGFDYVALNFLTHLNLWVLIPGTLAACKPRRWRIGLPAAAMAWGFYAYAVLVSGDFMAMGRFIVPAWPFTVLVFAWVLHDMAGAPGTSGGRKLLTWIGGGMTIVVGLLPAWNVHPIPEDLRAAHLFRFNRNAGDFRSEVEQWADQSHNVQRRAVQGRAMKRWIAPGSTVVMGSIGSAGYYSELFVHDTFGLVSGEVAALPDGDPSLEPGMRSPGHDKRVPVTFFLPEEPDVLDVRLVDHLGSPDRRGAERVRNYIERNWLSRLEDEGLVGRYGVEFRPVPDWEYGGRGQLLVWWQKLEPGTDERKARRTLQERLDRYVAGEDPYHDEVEDGWPAPLRPIPGRTAAP